ncbi:hypothetical protein RIF29_42097 [Crotalaria pallida]|uniref:Uncharacterized protein n=1 Tax=Crotalaria pallida TaxID=3830 RepID=A0AAN9E6V7_CROPI
MSSINELITYSSTIQLCKVMDLNSSEILKVHHAPILTPLLYIFFHSLHTFLIHSLTLSNLPTRPITS